MTKLYPITVSHHDGSFYATAQDSIEAGLLGGMVEAQAWATRTNQGSIAWTEVTDRFVKGHLVISGQRILVLFSQLPMAAEDTLIDWLFADVKEPVVHRVDLDVKRAERSK